MRHLRESRAVADLADRLGHVPEVSRYDRPDDPEGWELAHAFSDLEEHFDCFNNELLPRLVAAQRNDEIHEVLRDVGEIFRLIAYHFAHVRYDHYLRGLYGDTAEGDI
jgi:hypothetical protein